MSKVIVSDEALDLIFREARSHKAWTNKPVSDTLLQAVYELAKMGPTSLNSIPMRVVFVKSDAAKARLKPHLDAGNVEKTMIAPVCAIIAHDTHFYEGMGARGESFKTRDNTEHLLRNSSLQGAYLMLAARALGLDCLPMSGFSNAGVDAAFLEGTHWKSNFLCLLGHGDAEKLNPRGPRLSFDDACRIL